MQHPEKPVLNESQANEIARMKAYFPYRIVFGVIDKNTGEFFVYAKPTKHTMNKLARDGHQVFTLQ
jgi:hypothetical protein